MLVLSPLWAQAASSGVDILILAPHPDDEVLQTTGVIKRALSDGRRVAVAVLTNGDFTCARDGHARQRETVAALGSLGIDETDVHFLGYPDGYLDRLGGEALPAVERRAEDGSCARGAQTYASHGAGATDEHRLRTGRAAAYNADELTADLAALLERLHPRDVYLPHAIDDHPDHAATYVYFRRAIERLALSEVLVHRFIVHAGPCWPSDCQQFFAPDSPMPPLPSPLQGYSPDERLPSDAALKMGVIAHYPSQTGPAPTSDWLASFAKSDEVFFTERWRFDPARKSMRRVGSAPSIVLEFDFTNDSDHRFAIRAASGAVSVFDIALAASGQLSLTRLHDEHPTLIRRWRWPSGTAAQLKLELSFDANGEFSEWSLYAPQGFFGQAVLPAF